MKRNLGCGNERLAGWLDVDLHGEPELRLDLEPLPWPWESDSVDEIRLHHVLEHLGGDPRAFPGIRQELHRVSRSGGRLHLTVPHPRHDTFLAEPTHVRALLPETLRLSSRSRCLDGKERGVSHTPLALQFGVDFEIERRETTYDPHGESLRRAGQVSEEELRRFASQLGNVIQQFFLELRIVKDAA